MIFNINNYVKVKLTDLGKETLLRDNNEFWIKHNKPEFIENFALPKEDIMGYSTFQLWSLMSKFGPYLGNGRPLMFETEIIIEDKE